MQSDNIGELNYLIIEETGLIRHIIDIDNGREKSIHKIQEDLGLQVNSSIHMSELCELLSDQDDVKYILNLQQRLNSQIELLKDENTTLQILISNADSFVNYSINLILTKNNKNVIYQKPVT